VTRTSAQASVEVDVDPKTAFEIFTEEIDLWWVRGPINFFDSSRLVEYRMEPGVGGRVLEIYDEAAGDVLEVERVAVWEPGVRLVLRGVVLDTETDVRFEATADGRTRVHVSQYLVPGGDATRLGFGWTNMLRGFDAWSRRRDLASHEPREISRFGLALHYEDPAAAARWLRDVFQLGSWDVDRAPAESERPGWIDLHIGDTLLVLRPLEGDRPARRPHTHNTWVYVDDLDAHFAHATERGATIVSGISLHGSRTYVAEDLEGYRWTFVQARPTMR
jgi:uncharacterized glyoxalase superfamily protein PhnB